MILVTGAAGKTGQAVLRALQANGAATRGLVRNAEQAAAVEALGASAAIGDLQDGAALKSAMRDASAIYLICPNVHPAEFEIAQATIKAAQQAGVERFVYHSVLYPQIEAMPHHWLKLCVEEQLITSGLDFTVLQPASYMQNMLPYLNAIRENGEYRVPYSVSSTFSPVDLNDVAQVAAAVLSSSHHSGAIYQLAGPQELNSSEMATAVGTALNLPAKAVRQSLEDWQGAARANGAGAYAVDTLTQMFEYYDAHGFSASSFTLKALLGRAPTTFEEFLRRELQAK
jgi:NAD(P)H dehydrogenase (quinone)